MACGRLGHRRVVGLSVLLGLMRGVVRELIALCGWILAAWLAFQFAARGRRTTAAR